MREHLERWQSLTLSPADRAILDQMEEEMDPKMRDQMTTIQYLMGEMAATAKETEAERRKAGRFCDFDEDLGMTGDWDYAKEDWAGYIGPRLRSIWNSLTPEIRHDLAADFSEQAAEDWSRGIDAMGEDA